MNLVTLFRDGREKLPDKKNGKRGMECNIENFVPMVAVTKQKAEPSIEFSTAKGNLEREQEVEDTMLDLLQPHLQKDWKNEMHLRQLRQPTHEVVEEQSRDEKLPSVVTDAGGERYSGKDTKKKKGIIVCQPRRHHNVFNHYPKDPNCRFVRRQRQHEPGVE